MEDQVETDQIDCKLFKDVPTFLVIQILKCIKHKLAEIQVSG